MFLPVHLPLSVTEMEASPAFMSDDPEVVRAALYLWQAAWSAQPPGSVPSSEAHLARLVRLGPDKLRAHWDLLFQGWDLREDGRLWHPVLQARAEAIRRQYGEDLERLGAALAMASQPLGDEPFDLVAPIAKQSEDLPKRSKRSYPKDFTPNETSRKAMLAAGYISEEEQRWLLERFADFGTSSRRMYVDWQATFRNFLNSSITIKDFQASFGYRPGQRRAALAALPSEAAPAQRLRAMVQGLGDTFAQRSLNNARTMMAAAMARRNAMAQDQVVEMPRG